MVKVNLGGCASFVKDEDYKKYVGKALEAFDVLESESGAGNDFLGWKHLPSQTPESLIADCEAVRDCWKAKGVNLVVVIGIGDPISEPAAPSRHSPTISPSSLAGRKRLRRLSSQVTIFPKSTSRN